MPILENQDPEIRAMQGVHVFHAGMSNCSMRVRLLLDEKGVPWVSHEIDLGHQGNLEPSYLRVNPKGLVPALVHDGTVVTESCDILNYLEQAFPEPSFVPTDPEQAAGIQDWVERASDLHIKAMKTFMYGATGGSTKKASDMDHYREIQPDRELVEFHQKASEGFTAEEVSEAERLNHALLAEMERLLENQAYLSGDTYGLADMAWAPNMFLLRMLSFPLENYPRVSAWFASIEKRPAWKTAVDDQLPHVPNWLMRGAVKALRWWHGT